MQKELDITDKNVCEVTQVDIQIESKKRIRMKRKLADQKRKAGKTSIMIVWVYREGKRRMMKGITSSKAGRQCNDARKFVMEEE